MLEIGFVGVFDDELYKSKGAFYFCELNLRYGSSGYAIMKMGVNLPAMMEKCRSGESIEDMPKIINGSPPYVNERMCMDDWNNGDISRKEYQDYMRMADIDLFPASRMCFSKGNTKRC